MKKEVIKKNIFYMLMIGIEGLAFSLIDWNNTISDILYLEQDNKKIITLIAAGASFAKVVATLICIKLSDSKNTKKIFSISVILLSILSLILGKIYQLNYLLIFSFLYILTILILEIFSGYHYAFVSNFVPHELATKIHSKRISIFKITFMLGIGLASLLTTNLLNSTLTIITKLSAIIFILLLIPINKINEIKKENQKETQTFLQKMNFKDYTKYFKSWLVTRFLGKFALSSLIIILSMQMIDHNMSVSLLKGSKTFSWIISGLGFWLSSYLLKDKKIVKYDVAFEIIIAILIPITFLIPEFMYIILLIKGLVNPLNTISNFVMIEIEEDKENIAQKEMVVNLLGYFASFFSSILLLNIKRDIALIIITFTLSISALNEIRLLKQTKAN